MNERRRGFLPVRGIRSRVGRMRQCHPTWSGAGTNFQHRRSEAKYGLGDIKPGARGLERWAETASGGLRFVHAAVHGGRGVGLCTRRDRSHRHLQLHLALDALGILEHQR
jgi:hypothetical protein